jgi:hypothetical protein
MKVATVPNPPRNRLELFRQLRSLKVWFLNSALVGVIHDIQFVKTNLLPGDLARNYTMLVQMLFIKNNTANDTM